MSGDVAPQPEKFEGLGAPVERSQTRADRMLYDIESKWRILKRKLKFVEERRKMPDDAHEILSSHGSCSGAVDQA